MCRRRFALRCLRAGLCKGEILSSVDLAFVWLAVLVSDMLLGRKV